MVRMANVLIDKMLVPSSFRRTRIVYRHNANIIQLAAYLSLHFANTSGRIVGDADFADSMGGVVHDIQTSSYAARSNIVCHQSKLSENRSHEIVNCTDYQSGNIVNCTDYRSDNIIYKAQCRLRCGTGCGYNGRDSDADGAESAANQRTLCRAFRRRMNSNDSGFTIECSVFLDSRDSAANCANSPANKRTYAGRRQYRLGYSCQSCCDGYDHRYTS